ncbi:type VI secretion system protein TssA [Pseudomonas lalucatii]|uniref:Type VI secretion system protein TssA n=1 Tax=Pseudomonas lalucatii TaxID=1424203 RepID=A0ABS5Q1F4_9PSED|nr:type VI secretion system protein TssA [Pseudomonas lalucatii]
MTYSNTLTAHYLELAKLPINQGDFAGADMRYSSEYEVLENELGKASALHETTAIDWQKVRACSEALLSTQSKDLRVAAWLIWGLYQRESFAGLQAGLSLLHYLCLNHWADLHPRKPRTRAAAVGWLLPRLEQALAEHVPIGEQLALFRSLAEQLRALEACLSAHLGADAPLLLPLCRRLDELVSRASQGQPEPGSVGAAIAQVKQVATQLLTPGAPVENEKEAHKNLRSLQDQARPLCAYWLRQKASDLRALRLARTLLWLPIDSLPERNAEQVTALRGLPADKLASYQERYQQGQYADLLVDLEASIARAPFWLDGQHLVWQCLQPRLHKILHTLPHQPQTPLLIHKQPPRRPHLLALHGEQQLVVLAAPFVGPEFACWLAAPLGQAQPVGVSIRVRRPDSVRGAEQGA